jgi:hypothetical protein
MIITLDIKKLKALPVKLYKKMKRKYNKQAN